MRLALALFAAACAALAQQPPTLKVEYVRVDPEISRIEVRFSEALEAGGVNLDEDNVTCAPDDIVITGVATVPGRSRALRLTYKGALADPAKLSLTFKKLTFLRGSAIHAAENVKAQGSESIEARRERVRRLVTQQPKPSSQKNIFASGFVTTASGGTTGGADIALNPDLGIPGLTSFVQIKKTTQEGGDPKNFEGGARYRKGISFERGLLRRLQTASTADDLSRIQNQISNSWWAGGVFDFAAKLEGMATTFDISNFVGETGFQVLTRTKALGGSRKGFWRAFVAPGAIEGGQSLRAGDTTLQKSGTPAGVALKQVDWIARYKTGLGMTLFFEDTEAAYPLRRVELDMNGVMRNLFFAEAMYNKQTTLIDRTGKGVRAYGQIDLKLYMGETAKARYGFKLSYNRGSLPPAFARVKSFQFGFLWESNDDTQQQ